MHSRSHYALGEEAARVGSRAVVWCSSVGAYRNPGARWHILFGASTTTGDEGPRLRESSTSTMGTISASGC